MRVIVVTPYYPHSANPSNGIFIHQQVLALQELGHEVEVIHFVRRVPFWRNPRELRFQNRYLPRGRELLDGVPVERIAYYWPSRKSLDRFWIPILGRRLVKFFSTRALSPQTVIYAQWLLPTAAACLRVKKRFGTPLVAVARGSDLNTLAAASPAMRRELEAVVKEADRLATNGEWAIPELERLGFPAAAWNLTIIRNVKDLSPFAGITPSRPLSPADNLRLLCVSALDQRKGIDLILHALARRPPGRDFQLVILGEGLERNRLEELAADLGLSEKVYFRGVVEHEQVAAILAESHLFVLPSRREGLPNALVEAMAAGRACIGAKVGGIPELIEDGVTGLLVPPEDPGALAEAINRLAADDDLRIRLGENARKKALALFNREEAFRRLNEILTAAAKGRRALGDR